MDVVETDFTRALRRRKRAETIDYYLMYTCERYEALHHAQLLVHVRPRGGHGILCDRSSLGAESLSPFLAEWHQLPESERGTLLRLDMKAATKFSLVPHHSFGFAKARQRAFSAASPVNDYERLRAKARRLYYIGTTTCVPPARLCDFSIEAANSSPVFSVLGFNCRDYVLEVWARILEEEARGSEESIRSRRETLETLIAESRNRDIRLFIAGAILFVLLFTIAIVLLVIGLQYWLRPWVAMPPAICQAAPWPRFSYYHVYK